MISGSGLQLDAAQLERAMSRNAIIRMKGESAGYKFIRLVLKSERYIKNRISGVEILHGIPFVNAKKGNMTDIMVQLSSGDVEFELEPSTLEYTYEMLDTPYNRKFLATHRDYNIWEITDETVKKEIDTIYDQIKGTFVKKAPEQPEQETSETPKTIDAVPPAIPENMPDVPRETVEIEQKAKEDEQIVQTEQLEPAGTGVVTPGIDMDEPKRLRGRPAKRTPERARVAVP